MADGTSPLLTKSQREVLLEIAERETLEFEDGNERTHRSRLRERVRDIIKDFAFLTELLPRQDRQELFDELHAYREFRAEELEAMRDMPTEGRRRMRAVPEKNDTEQAGEELYDGIVATLAFLYSGVDDRTEFERMLEKAIQNSRHAEGRIALDIEVDITVERDRDHERLVQQFAARELDLDEIEDLLNADPLAIFKAKQAGLNDVDEE